MNSNKKAANVCARLASGAIAACVSLALVACGGGGGGSAAVGGTSSAKNVTVVPALGGFSQGAKVAAYKPNGDVIATVDTNSQGEAVLDFAAYDGPFILKVTGAAGVKYYDEGTGQLEDFGATDVLLSVVPASTIASGDAFGVTPVTNMVAALAGVTSTTLTLSGTSTEVQAKIDAAVTDTKKILVLQATGLDIFAKPAPMRSSSDAKPSASSAAGKYGLILAGMAAQAHASGKSAKDQAAGYFNLGRQVKNATTNDQAAVLAAVIAAQDAMALALDRVKADDSSFSYTKVALDSTYFEGKTTSQLTTSRSISVVPALGLFKAGTKVEAFDPDPAKNGARIAMALTNASGVATLDIGTTYNGPMILKVSGADGLSYFDSATGADVAFGVGKSLLALVPSDVIKTDASFGVNIFTHASAAFAGVTATQMQITPPTDATITDVMVEAMARTRWMLGLSPDSKTANIHALNFLIAPKLLSAVDGRLDPTASGGVMGIFLAEVTRVNKESSGGVRTPLDLADFFAAEIAKLRTANYSTAGVDVFTKTSLLTDVRSALVSMASGSRYQSTCLKLTDADSAYLKKAFTDASTAIKMAPTTELGKMEANVKQAVRYQAAGDTFPFVKISTCGS